MAKTAPSPSRAAPASATSQGYSDRLSPYENKGDLNLRHDPEPALCVLYKARHLANLITAAAPHVVFHTGAGISTNAGIPDFRGPDGVWTKQSSAPPRQSQQQQTTVKKRRRLSSSSSSNPSTSAKRTISFESALPTVTHCVIKALLDKRLADYVISQNVDNLHSRSGVPRDKLSELHGNLFVDWCRDGCGREYQRDSQAVTVGHKPTSRLCPHCEATSRVETVDKALDWEDALPEPDYERAQTHAQDARLHIVAGTSCQMTPARSLPFSNTARKAPARALVNLSRTPFDTRFGTVVRADTDSVFAALAVFLDVGDMIDTVRRSVTFGFTTKRTLAYDVDKEAEIATVRCDARVKWDGLWMSKDDVYGVKGVQYAIIDVPVSTPVSAEDFSNINFNWSPLSSPSMSFAHQYPTDTTTTTATKTAVYARILTVPHPADKHHLTNDNTYIVPIPLDKPFDDGPQIQVVTRVERHQDRILYLLDKLQKEAFGVRTPTPIDVHNVFVSSEKRGWSLCVLCRKLIWPSGNKREQHMHQCVRDIITSHSSSSSSSSSQSSAAGSTPLSLTES